MSGGPSIDAAYVELAARGVGLALTPEQMPGVLANPRLMAAVAQAVNDFPLAEDSESAAVFTPCSAPQPE